MYLFVLMCLHVYIATCACVYVCAHACVCVCVCVCACVCVCVCLCVCEGVPASIHVCHRYIKLWCCHVTVSHVISKENASIFKCDVALTMKW